MPRESTSPGRAWSLVNGRTRGMLRAVAIVGTSRAERRARKRPPIPRDFRKMPGQRGKRWRAWAQIA